MSRRRDDRISTVNSLFFVTVNSNQRPKSKSELLTLRSSAQDGIHEVSEKLHRGIVKLQTKSGRDARVVDFDATLVKSTTEIGGSVNSGRVHVHYLVKVKHSADFESYLDIDEMREIFKSSWNLPSVYIKVQYSPMNDEHAPLRQYMEKWKFRNRYGH